MHFELSNEELDSMKEVFNFLADDNGKLSLCDIAGRMEDNHKGGGETIENNRKLGYEMMNRILSFSEVQGDWKVNFQEMVYLMKKAMNMR